MVRVKENNNGVDAKIEFASSLWDEFEEVFELPSEDLQSLIEDADSTSKAVKDFICSSTYDISAIMGLNLRETENANSKLICSLLAQHVALPPPVLVKLNLSKEPKNIVNMDLNSLKAFSSGDGQYTWQEMKNAYINSTIKSSKKARVFKLDTSSTLQKDDTESNSITVADQSKSNKYDDIIPLSVCLVSPDSTDIDNVEHPYSTGSQRDFKSKELLSLLTNWKHIFSYPHTTKIISNNKSSKQVSKSATAVRGRNGAPPLEIATTKNETLLGRRGRHYSDVWQEEDYLESLSVPMPSGKFQPLSDWNQFLRNYNENHDGYYREWLLQTYRNRLDALKSSKSFKKRRKNATGMLGSFVANEDEKQDILKPVPPPVPVSAQHPASWGIGNRVSCAHADYNIVHPACTSSTVVYPPGYFVKQRSSSNVCTTGDTTKEKFQNNRNRVEHMEEDVDIFNICAEIVQEHLNEQELVNSVRLLRLRHFVEMDRRIRVVRAKRKVVEQVLTHAFISNAPKNSDREMYRMKFCMKSTNGSFFNLSGSSSSSSTSMETHSNLDEISPPSSSSTNITGDVLIKSAAIPASTNRGISFLGALVCSQIKYGCSLRTIKNDFVLEYAYYKIEDHSKKWWPAVVTRLQHDGHVLRHIKVCPLKLDKNKRWHMQLRESLWLKVEDGLAAPLGTHSDALKHIRAEDSASIPQMTVPVFGEWKYDFNSQLIVSNKCENAESVYCEFCRSNALAKEEDTAISLVELPQPDNEECVHSKEKVDREEGEQLQLQLQPQPQQQPQQQDKQDKQHQAARTSVEATKKIRIQRSKDGIKMKAAPREEPHSEANMESSIDPLPGRKQRDVFDVLQEQSKMLLPEQVEQFQRHMVLPSYPNKQYPADLSAHPHQLPHPNGKQPTPQLIYNSRNSSNSTYKIPPLAAYFSRADSSRQYGSNSSLFMGQTILYPFPKDSHSSVHNMPAFQVLESSLQNNNNQSTDLAGDGSFFPKTTSTQQF